MIPYRTRHILRRLAIGALVLALLAGAVVLCWFLWLNRYVLYTRNGASLNFNMNMEFPLGQTPENPAPGQNIDIYYNEGENAILPENPELTQLAGINITMSMLNKNFDKVVEKLATLPRGSQVMLDMKNIKGEYFYNSQLGSTYSKIDPDKMEQLIHTLHRSGCYLIARVPALRDYWYGLYHVKYGIFNPNRYSLWMDDQRCYWLNPKSDGTMSYLVQIAKELRNLGFDEVVFTDFQVPDTEAIYFPYDRAEAINSLAASLVTICTTDHFAVSFATNKEDFVLPDGRCRLYIDNATAVNVSSIAERTGISDPDIRLVFLTDRNDTRFEAYGVLRPIELAP